MSEGCYDDAKKYLIPEVGIYKRKQESQKTRTQTRKRSRKTRKQELDQESDQEKKKNFLFFLITCFEFLFSSLFSFFLDRFLGRALFFLFSNFLVFFYKFPTQALDFIFPVLLLNSTIGTWEYGTKLKLKAAPQVRTGILSMRLWSTKSYFTVGRTVNIFGAPSHSFAPRLNRYKMRRNYNNCCCGADQGRAGGRCDIGGFLTYFQRHT